MVLGRASLATKALEEPRRAGPVARWRHFPCSARRAPRIRRPGGATTVTCSAGPGPPTTLRFVVFSRFSLVLLCSGPMLLVGLLVLARRPPPRWVGTAGLMVALGLGTFTDSSTLIPLAQSAMPGVVLWLGAFLMHWYLERRGHDRRGDGQPSMGNAQPSGLSVDVPQDAGADESTAIRVRPTSNSAVSTTDHIVLTRTPARVADDGSATNVRDLR